MTVSKISALLDITQSHSKSRKKFIKMHTLELLNKEQLWQHYCYSVVNCHICNCWSSFAAPRPVRKIQNMRL